MLNWPKIKIKQFKRGYIFYHPILYFCTPIGVYPNNLWVEDFMDFMNVQSINLKSVSNRIIQILKMYFVHLQVLKMYFRLYNS